MDGCRQRLELTTLAPAVARRLERWMAEETPARLLSGDPTLWSRAPWPELADRLGWLTLPSLMSHEAEGITAFAEEVRRDGISTVLVLGMGGSSLAPEVFQHPFGPQAGFPRLRVLDSTHPGAIRAATLAIDPASTLFVVASKSGTTIEPLSFYRYFRALVEASVGDPGRHFVAITDPGTPLVDLATEERFRRTFLATPDVGGRYSALAHFGLVPAALIGLDVMLLIERAQAMADATSNRTTFSGPLALGAVLAEAAAAGRDKATWVTSPGLDAYPDWVEQLLAESTGKSGTGIIPVVHEPLGPAETYGPDRLFIHLSEGTSDPVTEESLRLLAAAGHPIVRITTNDPYDLAGEMYRAEVAVAMAGAAMGIHPFNQPDVQRAKELAKDAMAGTTPGAAIPETNTADSEALARAVGDLLSPVRQGDYVAIQAFIEPTPEAVMGLGKMRTLIRHRLAVATTVGFGPRFLHSTGQLHKGGPAGGHFIQIVDDPAPDIAVPGTDYTFGRLIAGQADGDYRALVDADRAVIRVRLGADGDIGLAALAGAIG